MRMSNYILVVLSALVFFSCEKETEGISRITYYCELDLNEGDTFFSPLGEPYQEPGWVATEKGEDVSERVSVKGAVNVNKAGIYTLSYSVLNSDGYPKNATRKVIVYNATPSVLESGIYKVSSSSSRTSSGSGPAAIGSAEYASEPNVAIYQVTPGTFFITDFIGGYYEVGRGYGSLYAMTGSFVLNSDNTITHVESYNGGWEDGLSDVVGSSYDVTTKTLAYTAQYANYDFNVILIKQ